MKKEENDDTKKLDDNLKIGFAAQGKNETVLSDILEIDSISIWLNRYGVRYKDAEKTTPNVFPKDGLVPSLYEYSYCKRYLRKGYAYVYDETLRHISEYLYDYSLFFPILKNTKNIMKDERDRVPSLEAKHFISASMGSTLWIAFSHVQWSSKYIEKYMSDATFRQTRGQKFDTRAYVGDDFCSILTSETYFPPESEEEREKYNALDEDFKYTYRFKEYAGRAAFLSLKKHTENMKDEHKQYMMSFSVNDPIGCAHDIAEELSVLLEHHMAFVQGMPYGKTAKEILANKDNASYINPDDPLVQQYYALYQSSSLMNKLILENPTNDAQYGSKVNKDTLRKVLGLEERKESYDKLINMRNALGRLLETNYYHNVLIDACEGSLKSIEEGQTIVLTHHGLLSIKPAAIDNELASKINLLDTQWDEYMHNSFFYGDSETKPKTLTPQKAGSSLQYTTRELLNINFRETSFFEDLKKGTEDFLITAKNLFINIDTSLGLYVYFIRTEKQLANFPKSTNSILDKKKDVIKIQNESISKIRDKALQELDEVVDKTYKNYGFFSKIFRRETIKKEILENANKIVDDLSDGVGEARKTASVNTKKLNSELDKLKAQELQLNNKIKKVDWIEAKIFQKFIGTLATINLVMATKRLYENPNAVNFFYLSGVATETTAAITAFAMSKETQKMILEKWIRAKNTNISLPCRISLIGSVILSGVTIWEGFELWGKKDHVTAGLYVGSGITGIAAAAVIWKGYAAGLVAIGPWGWALLAISFALIIIANFFLQDELERFIRATVYCDTFWHNNRIGDLGNKTPIQVMAELYNNGNPQAKVFVADDDVKYDLRDFRNMLRWLFEKLSYFRHRFSVENYHSDGMGQLIDSFSINCSFSAMLPISRIEYAMQITNPAHGASSTTQIFFIKPELEPRIDMTQAGTSINFYFDLVKWKHRNLGDMQIVGHSYRSPFIVDEDEDTSSSDDSNSPFLIQDQGNSHTESFRMNRYTSFTFSFRIVYDQYNKQSLPLSFDDNNPEYFVLQGYLYSPDNEYRVVVPPTVRLSKKTKQELGL